MNKKEEKNKRIKYKHVAALRDLSSAFSFKGIKLKKGLLYRSSFLGKLSQEEYNDFVNTFNIGTVIDLRCEDEINTYPDTKSDNVKYFHLPVLNNEQNPVITHENRSALLVDIVKNHGGAVKYLSKNYKIMVTNERSLSYYKQVFDILLNNTDGKAIDYHCTQGKDRTGICSALILMALGFDEDSIIRDYLNFNTPYRFKNITISVLVSLRFYSIRCSTSLYVLQMANYKVIKSAFDEIKKQYNTFPNYLEKALGLTADKIQKLKKMYLLKDGK